MKNNVQLEIPFETEEWRDIEGYEGLYKVSDLGRVRSLSRNTTNGKILKPQTNKQGYLYVVLYKDGKKKKYRVNRLVALVFIKNDDPEHKTQVNHINESVIDNRACNLNWMSPKENINWGTGILRSHQKQVNHPKRSKPVKQLSLDGDLIAIWPSASEAERNGFKHCSICACCQGRKNKHKGFKWAYA